MPSTSAQFPKEGAFDKVVAWVTLRGPLSRLERCLGRAIGADAYRIDRGEVIAPRGRRFRVSDVRTWQEVFICMGVPLIVTEFADGRRAEWSDRYHRLLTIMRDAAPEKELPWIAE